MRILLTLSLSGFSLLIKTVHSIFMSILPVFAGILLRHGSYLLFLKRSKKNRNWPLHWTIPGGKIEDGEEVIDCAIRETLEEVGVHIRRSDILAETTVHTTYVDGEKTAHIFLVDTWEGMPDNIERDLHDEFTWKTLADLPTPMIPHIRVGIEGILDHKKQVEYYAN